MDMFGGRHVIPRILELEKDNRLGGREGERERVGEGERERG